MHEITRKSKETLQRFPLSLLSSFLATFIAVYLIEVDRHYLVLANIAWCASLGVFLFTSVALFKEVCKTVVFYTLTALSVAGVVLYYFSLPQTPLDYQVINIFYRHFFISLLFFLALFWTPFFMQEIDNRDYWEYAKKLFLTLFVTVMFTIVMTIGIDGAMYAVEELFEIDIASKRYGQINLLIIGLFSVGYFLSQIMKEPMKVKQKVPLSNIERFFTKWVLTPLSLLYFVILYAYTFKVLVTFDWPKGILAWLIVYFSLVAVLTYLFWTHFYNEEESIWRRWIWLAVFFQTFMLFAAIGMRIAEYSWTEDRYMIVLLGVWLLGISLYFLLYRHARIKWIFVSLSLVILFSQVGPLNVYTVSRTAQTERLKDYLKQLEPYEVKKEAPIKVRFEISNISDHLYRRHGIDAFKELFPQKVEEFKALWDKRVAIEKYESEQRENNKTYISQRDKETRELFNKTQSFSTFLTESLGFEHVRWGEYKQHTSGKKTMPGKYISFSAKNEQEVLDITKFDYLISYRYYGRVTPPGKPYTGRETYKHIGVTIECSHNILKIEQGNSAVTVDIAVFFDKLLEKHGKVSKYLEHESLQLEEKSDSLNARIYFSRISRNSQETNATYSFTANILLGQKGE